MWDGWVDVEKPRAHIIGHWNYAAGTVKPVTVISSAERVELYLNGRLLGQGRQSERFLFTFDGVAWQAGELKAIGYDASGKRICEAVVASAGAPAALRLTVTTSPTGLHADGADLALVQVEAVDAQGRRNPVALNTVSFALQGPAEWRGGIAQGPNNHILARSLPLEGGVNRVLVRSATEAGKIVLRATADGLAPAELLLESKPVAVQGGLSTRLTGASLPSNLSRGPTPTGPSFTVSRISVPVVGVEAASNQEEAARSFDDDETTLWASKPGTGAAITYQLGAKTVLSEMTLKLSGWRERSYPLRVLVDGEVVFEGATPKSLGYVTLPLKPHSGSAVRIELTGAADERDAIKLTEVANQANSDTGANRTAKGVLSIVEVDFYKVPKQ
jgi:beta-galactosidase